MARARARSTQSDRMSEIEDNRGVSEIDTESRMKNEIEDSHCKSDIKNS